MTLAVIVTLVGVLAPALSSARLQARKLACATQLRSIGQAFTGFARDHDSLPRAARLMDVGQGTLQLPELLAPYLDDTPFVRGTRILPPWACPADQDMAPAGTGSYPYTPASMMNDPDDAWDPYLVPASASAARLALLAYEANSTTYTLMRDGWGFHTRPTPGSTFPPPVPIPGVPSGTSGWNALTFDGSVRDWP